MIVLLLCITIIIVVIVSLMLKSKQQMAGTDVIELEEEHPSTIHFSDDFKTEKTVTRMEDNHYITIILMGKKDKHMWVCENCETENPNSTKKCCVCNYLR